MGIFLTFLGVIFVCVIIIILTNIISDKYDYNKTNNKIVEHLHNNLGAYCRTSIVVGIAAILGAIICIAVSTYTVIIKNEQYEKYVLIYENITALLEQNNDNCYLLTEDITKYNNEIMKQKHWANNLWMNWYYNNKVANLPIIKL